MGNTTEIGIKVVVDGKEGSLTLGELRRGLLSLDEAGRKAKESLMDKFSAKGAMIFTGLNQGLELARKAFDFLSKPVTLAMDAEQAQVSFDVMLGSAEAADKMIKQLKEDAAKTPFEFTDLQQATQTLLSFGIEAGNVRGILSMLGDVSGGNSEKLKSLSMVMGQVASAGKLQGQDLLQMINVGFNPLNEISRTTGKTMAQLRKDMEGGKISYDMVVGAFKSATSEGGRFNGMMQKQSLTLGGLISTLSDNLNQGLTNFAQSGLFEKIKSGVDSIGKWIDENKEKITEGITTAGKVIGNVFDIIVTGAKAVGSVIKFLWDYKAAILGLAGAIGILVIAANAETIALTAMYAWDMIVINAKKVWTAVQWLLNAAMNANPIVLIISAVIFLIGLIYTVVERTIGWAKAWNYIKAAFTIAWDYMKAFFSFVINFSSGLIKVLTLPWTIMWNTASEIFGKIGSIMKKLIAGDFAGIWEDIKSGFSKGFSDAVNSTMDSFKNAFNAFDGLGEKAAQTWAEAGKDAAVHVQKKQENKTETTITGSGTKTKEMSDEERKAAADRLEARRKDEIAKAKETIENELELEQKLLDINKKFDLEKVQLEKKSAQEKDAEIDKINGDYRDKQIDLNKKTAKALKEQRKEELQDAWSLREAELKYNNATGSQILEEKKLHLELIRDLYKKGTKEWKESNKDVNLADWDLKMAQRDQAREREITDREISSRRARLSINPNDKLSLDKQDEEEAFNKDMDDLLKRLQKGEITGEQFRNLAEIREKEHQKRLNQIKEEYYDDWLGTLAGLSKQELDIIKSVIDNVGSTFGKIGDMVYNSAKKESDSYKKTELDKLKTDREKALSHARSQAQKDRINKQYDEKQKQIEDEADKRAREKAQDWYAVQKAANVASATMATYDAGAKALGNPPVGPWNIALAAVVIAAGLANVASIIATPLPGFARGIIGIDGPGTETSDSILARLSKGESVLNAESTKAAFPLLGLMNASASFASWANDLIMNGSMPKYAMGMVGVPGGGFYSPRPSVSTTIVNDNGDLLKEMKNISKNLDAYSKRPQQISSRISKVLYYSADKYDRKSTL